MAPPFTFNGANLFFSAPTHTLTDSFDHLQFPGVVPRTALGAFGVSLLVTVPHELLRVLGVSKFISQYLVRACLGLLVFSCMRHFKHALQTRFPSLPHCGPFFMLLTAAQFHIPFYASRALPNVFALMGTLLAYSSWLRGAPLLALLLVGTHTVIFRCDLAVLLLPMAGVMLVGGEVRFIRSAIFGLFTCLAALFVSVAFDSSFWGRLLWPEGVVLFFNTVENRSSDYGEHPWHWYASSALPRALTGSLPVVYVTLFVALLIVTQRLVRPAMLTIPGGTVVVAGAVLYYTLPAVLYVALYSFLPHKELRFLFPALPVLTLAAAVGLAQLTAPGLDVSSDKNKKVQETPAMDSMGDVSNDPGRAEDEPPDSHSPSPSPTEVPKPDTMSSVTRRGLGWLLLLGIGVSSAVLNCVFLAAARRNYPGGPAMAALHAHLSPGHCVRVHIDAAAATRGVTRFSQLRRPSEERHLCVAEYSKDESTCDLTKYELLITADPAGGCHRRSDSHVIVETIPAFDGRLQIGNYLGAQHGMSASLESILSGFIALGHALGQQGLDALVHQSPALYLMKKTKDVAEESMSENSTFVPPKTAKTADSSTKKKTKKTKKWV